MNREAPDGALDRRARALHALVLAACLALPWALHLAVGWWAGLIAFVPLAALYGRLFVPPGSLCMGMPFTLVMVSFMALAALDLFTLTLWLAARRW